MRRSSGRLVKLVALVALALVLLAIPVAMIAVELFAVSSSPSSRGLSDLPAEQMLHEMLGFSPAPRLLAAADQPPPPAGVALSNPDGDAPPDAPPPSLPDAEGPS